MYVIIKFVYNLPCTIAKLLNYTVNRPQREDRFLVFFLRSLKCIVCVFVTICSTSIQNDHESSRERNRHRDKDRHKQRKRENESHSVVFFLLLSFSLLFFCPIFSRAFAFVCEILWMLIMINWLNILNSSVGQTWTHYDRPISLNPFISKSICNEFKSIDLRIVNRQSLFSINITGCGRWRRQSYGFCILFALQFG